MLPESFSVTGLTLGQYEIGERIGSGGMATVYRGRQISLNREVAIKVLPAHFSNDETFVERFKQEAVSVANLRHPNILSVIDFGEQNGIIYMVTEFVPGGNLAERLGVPLDLDDVLGVMTPLASALDYAHSRGIVHRDLKPANVLMTLTDEPILADFGLARILEGTRLTRSGSALGTPEYMAPEQAMAATVSAATDIYAFGIVLFEMLTGTVPFGGDTPVAIILAQLQQPPPSPRGLNPAIPAQVEAVILTCLEKDPHDRFPSARAVVQALESTRPRDHRHGGLSSTHQATPMPATRPAEADSSQPADQNIEFGELRLNFESEKLMWNGNGTERARQLIRKRLQQLQKEGWELAGSLHDPGILQQGNSLRGTTVRGAILYLRRTRR